MEWPPATLLVLAIATGLLLLFTLGLIAATRLRRLMRLLAAVWPSARGNSMTRRMSNRIAGLTAAWMKTRQSRHRSKLLLLHRMRTFTLPDFRPDPDPLRWR